MQLIAADIGNSSIKVAVEHAAEDDRWCLEFIFRDEQPLESDANALDIGDEPAFWSVSSVNLARQHRLRDWIIKHRPNDQFHVIEPNDVDLKTDVESREHLGRDRLIAAWMAVQLNDGTGPIVVIDAGTAVTIDLIDRKLVFQGGVIFPGAESNFRRLSEYTHALPDLGRDNRPVDDGGSYSNVIGKSTNDAIIKGVFQSQISAIRGIADQMAACSNARTSIFATGGGISDIISDLPEEWDSVPDLVLRGAREIGRRLMYESGNSQTGTG